MTVAFANFRKHAKEPAKVACSRKETALQINSIVMRAARILWPSKTALEISIRAGVSERMAHYWLSEKYDIPAEALAALLRTDAGLSILEQIMGDAKPKWWRRIKRSSRIASLRAAQAEQQRLLEQYEMEFGSDDD